MLYVDKSKADVPSYVIVNAKRELKDTPGTTVCYDSLLGDTPSTIREHLCADQGWLCVYCMRRISLKPEPGVSRMAHTEHYIPRHQHGDTGKALPYPEYSQADLDEFSLDYNNLFATCDGKYIEDEQSEEEPEEEYTHAGRTEKAQETCDKPRGNQRLTVDPRNPVHIASIRYGKTNALIDSSDSAIASDLTKKLNLNYHWLVAERASTLSELYEWFSVHAKDNNFRKECEERLQTLKNGDSSGKRQPFAQMLIWALEKRMRRMN
ncbi:hypothetical protein [Bifidobacterium aerophilum]|uniref:TIGR02646 family protein n=1 Tax=Bifidobacterium aerophilum TaxID=1798155 RepID=A0A6N9Z8P2_9BIFI|nr:hypothetical protein [Bifidobacterium aerophilum]NEG90455.1 hypothetical protein [Bifidobacterium aerophilum]